MFWNKLCKMVHQSNANIRKIAYAYYKNKILLQITAAREEKTIQQSNECWYSEEPFTCEKDEVRDHDHLTGKYRGATHIRCKLNCKQTFLGLIFF